MFVLLLMAELLTINVKISFYTRFILIPGSVPIYKISDWFWQNKNISVSITCA